jgi:hypothetical protein
MRTNIQEAVREDHRPARQTRLTAHRRRIALLAAIETLRARFGPGIIRHVGDLLAPAPGAERLLLSTGSLGIDLLVGGLPRGAISEYAGVEGAGSETLAITALARCQQGGGLVMLLDAEGTADPDALFAAGLDLHALILACPAGAQEAWSALIALVGSGALDLVAVALPALYALPGAPPGGSPPRALERLRPALRGRSTTVLVTNAPAVLRRGSLICGILGYGKSTIVRPQSAGRGARGPGGRLALA